MRVSKDFGLERLNERDRNFVLSLYELLKKYESEESWRVLIKRFIARVYKGDVKFDELFYKDPELAIKQIIDEFNEMHYGAPLERFIMRRIYIRKPLRKGNIQWSPK